VEPSVLTFLPEVTVGVATVIALVYITRSFLIHLKDERETHYERIDKRDDQFRKLEAEVRNNIMGQLNENTEAFRKVINHINSNERRN
jgi:hypothetical protein